ncbi:MAG TPA: hypothetical protein EYP92_00290 [Candidatus Thioglobus sp.]|nr:hypothetical protein [Candidatus Thioglobus sp.]
MSTNVFFNHKVRSEQSLYEDIIIESLKMFGQDVYYIPREVITEDELLNEDYARFVDAYSVEMYIENTDNFGGEGDLMSKFGLQIRDQATFIVSKLRWEREIGLNNKDEQLDRPSEGDLIYLPLSNSMFQISHVEHAQPFYALGNLPTYKLNAELFEYSSQEIDTGISDIDTFETKYSNYEVFGLTKGSGTFIIGETVTQETAEIDVFITGEVSKVSFPSGTTQPVIYINDETGTDGSALTFRISSEFPIVGSTSGASWNIYADVSTLLIDGKPLTDKPLHTNDPEADNLEFKTVSDAIIDFSETNPFGEP